jgi:uncharacterized protein YqeY
MLRQRLSEALKEAMKARDERAISTTRLIIAALKDRDIAARGRGQPDGIGEDDIQSLLRTMVKQRQEAIQLFEQGGRMELVEQEKEEIAVIQRFMPRQLSDDEIKAAVAGVIKELDAHSLKDIGRCMAALKERHAGEMDFGKASGMVRQALG